MYSITTIVMVYAVLSDPVVIVTLVASTSIEILFAAVGDAYGSGSPAGTVGAVAAP